MINYLQDHNPSELLVIRLGSRHQEPQAGLCPHYHEAAQLSHSFSLQLTSYMYTWLSESGRSLIIYIYIYI